MKLPLLVPVGQLERKLARVSALMVVVIVVGVVGPAHAGTP